MACHNSLDILPYQLCNKFASPFRPDLERVHKFVRMRKRGNVEHENGEQEQKFSERENVSFVGCHAALIKQSAD